MRITLDSNAWEPIFNEARDDLAPLRAAFAKGHLRGFICASALRIEAICKTDRPAYFQQPHTTSDFSVVLREGRPMLKMSFGPDDSRHPGLPPQQKKKLDCAFRAGVKLIRGGAWMGLPSPQQIGDPSLYEYESPETVRERERREIEVFHQIEQRGVGKAAFDAADGWEVKDRSPTEAQQLSAACAEWADAETVSAHIAYHNEVLCTDDRGRNAGVSVLDKSNRAWLTSTYGVRFMTVRELLNAVG
jgi:hypothetical protein